MRVRHKYDHLYVWFRSLPAAVTHATATTIAFAFAFVLLVVALRDAFSFGALLLFSFTVSWPAVSVHVSLGTAIDGGDVLYVCAFAYQPSFHWFIPALFIVHFSILGSRGVSFLFWLGGRLSLA